MSQPKPVSETVAGWLEVLSAGAAASPRSRAILTAALYDTSCPGGPLHDGTCPGCDARLSFAVQLEQRLEAKERSV